MEIISKRELTELTFTTDKTPSRCIHIVFLREIIICDALRRIFEKKGIKVSFYLFMDDFDALNRILYYIDKQWVIVRLNLLL